MTPIRIWTMSRARARITALRIVARARTCTVCWCSGRECSAKVSSNRQRLAQIRGSIIVNRNFHHCHRWGPVAAVLQRVATVRSVHTGHGLQKMGRQEGHSQTLRSKAPPYFQAAPLLAQPNSTDRTSMPLHKMTQLSMQDFAQWGTTSVVFGRRAKVRFWVQVPLRPQ